MANRISTLVLSSLLFSPFVCSLALAQKAASSSGSGGGGGVTINIFPGRQEEKKASRWTLDSWFEQKRQVEKQNAWLWAHTTKNPVEFAFTGYAGPVQAGGTLDAYVARLGLQLMFDRSDGFFRSPQAGEFTNQSGTVDLQLRLFGGNLQDTNLILRGGYEYDDITSPSNLAGTYGGWGAGPELQIYFAQWLGVRGIYRHRFDRKSINGGTHEVGGKNWSAVGFLELGALRLEGGWENSELNQKSPTVESAKRSGLVGRLRLFY